jgi:hypothetical protein
MRTELPSFGLLFTSALYSMLTSRSLVRSVHVLLGFMLSVPIKRQLGRGADWPELLRRKRPPHACFGSGPLRAHQDTPDALATGAKIEAAEA